MRYLPIPRPGRTHRNLCAVTLLILFATQLHAQDVDSLLLRYKDELAVISDFRQDLVIKNEKGKLTANSYVSSDRLLIGELSPGIYNKEYIFHSYFNKLEDNDAYALIAGKKGYTKQRPSDSKTVHYDESNILFDDTKETEISFSGLTPKSLLKNEYSLSHNDIHILPSFYFQENIPVAKSTFVVTVPKYVHMKFVIKGSQPDRIKQTREENKNTVVYTFSATDIPAIKHFESIPSSDWYALHVIPYIYSYQLPGEDKEQIIGDLDHFYKYMFGFISKINVAEDDEITQTATKLTKGDKTQKEKAAHIYKWVQDNIHYIAFEDSLEGLIPRQAAAICKRKFGDCKDMASILVALCRKAGLDAYFTWIGTNSKPYTWEETPLMKVANHMICTVKIGDEWIFMDGTHPLIPFGKAPENIQGKEALVGINEKEYKIIKVPEADGASNVSIDTTFLSVNGKQVTGRATLDLQGYFSWDLQIQMMFSNGDYRDKLAKAMLERGSNKYMQKSYQYTPYDTGGKSCRLTADFVLDDYCQKVGNEYYVNLNMKPGFGNIEIEGRDVPVYFRYKDHETEVAILEVPAGYHVSFLPPEASGHLENIWDYKISYRQEGRKVIMNKEYHINAMSVASQYFAEHNATVDELKKQYKESVVLTAD